MLRYLTDAYRTLRQTVPEAHRTPELEDLVEWLGETVRQTDSSLLDEWEALTDPDAPCRASWPSTGRRPPRPISQQERAFRVMVRNAMFRRVELVARDDLDGLMALERAAADRTDPPREVVMTRSAWDAAIEDYYAEHDTRRHRRRRPRPAAAARRAATGEPPGARGHRAGSGRSARCCTTRRATTTG